MVVEGTDEVMALLNGTIERLLYRRLQSVLGALRFASFIVLVFISVIESASAAKLRDLSAFAGVRSN